MSKLYLFDIDNTLVQSSTLHRAAFIYSLKEVYGIDTDFEGVTFAGMTDSSIIYEILELNGLKEDGRLGKCMEIMTDYYKKNLSNETSVAIEGVYDLLNKLKQNNILGLVTGNVQEIGFSKLSRLNLDVFFETGGFGDDHHIRYKLVEKALSRFKKIYGYDFNDKAVVVGDTPKDIEAAHLAGLPVIAVAKGHYSVDILSKAGANWVISNYDDFPII